MTKHLWAMHGLTVRCDVALDARRAPLGANPDLIVRLGDRLPALRPSERPEGRVLASIADDDHAWLTVVVPEDELTAGSNPVDLHFHGVATARFDSIAMTVDLVLDPLVDSGLASVLLSGTVISAVLMLTGHPVLHASAVTICEGSQAIGFVGSSGMGKSTLATLACRDGALLLADDVLRTDIAGDVVLAFPGATAARLREQAVELGRETTELLAATADGRMAATPKLAAGTAVPLRALVVPQPDRTRSTLTLEPVTGPNAVFALAAHPRILGWRDPRTSAHAFLHWGAIAQRVPLMVAHVPWGPPFAHGLGAELIERTSMASVRD